MNSYIINFWTGKQISLGSSAQGKGLKRTAGGEQLPLVTQLQLWPSQDRAESRAGWRLGLVYLCDGQLRSPWSYACTLPLTGSSVHRAVF